MGYSAHSLGKGEVESSNLSGSTIRLKHLGAFPSPNFARTCQEQDCHIPVPLTHW